MQGNPTTGGVVNTGGGPNINIDIEDSKERITSMLKHTLLYKFYY